MTIEEIMKLKQEDCPRFSVFARDKLPMPGVKKRLDEILNHEITVTDFRITKSKRQENAECLQIQFLLGADICVAFTGSVVLLDQIKSVKNNIPFKTTLVKIDKYYSFS
ncbi:MAG: hypothetical protein J5611_01205 [Alphaproteobacteria bacterium]|nr:hypothetical protein [Alphaproteobacteria bacterium]